MGLRRGLFSIGGLDASRPFPGDTARTGTPAAISLPAFFLAAAAGHIPAAAAFLTRAEGEGRRSSPEIGLQAQSGYAKAESIKHL